MKTTIVVANVDEFFQRGKEIATLADQGKRIPTERVIAFEDPEDLARLMTTAPPTYTLRGHKLRYSQNC
jgi:hypothetical protein